MYDVYLITEPEPEVAPPVEDTAPKKYVPPAARRAAAQAASNPAPSPLHRGSRYGKKKEAPDVANEMEFPSLGGTTTAGDKQQEREL